MFIKVYIFGMKISQRIYFSYQISLKMLIFGGNGKKKIMFLVTNPWTIHKNYLN